MIRPRPLILIQTAPGKWCPEKSPVLPPTVATSAVLTPSQAPRSGAGNCRRCNGTGEGPGFGVLFCAQCGGTGDCGNAPQRVAVPGGGYVTINGPVPDWLAAMLRDPSAAAA